MKQYSVRCANDKNVEGREQERMREREQAYCRFENCKNVQLLKHIVAFGTHTLAKWRSQIRNPYC